MALENNEFQGTERFFVQSKLGVGGMGVVYRVYDNIRNEVMALKTLKRMSAQALYRFKNEFRALADLRHPNLIRLGELINEEDRWFFTMEYVEGIHFLDFIRQVQAYDDLPYLDTRALAQNEIKHTLADDKTLVDSSAPEERFLAETEKQTPQISYENESRLRDAFAQLTTGLSALHTLGKVHRDIKPSNIMVTPEFRVVLMDFGLVAEVAEEEQDSKNMIIGTPQYMAPEQASGEPPGPEADYYSIGVMLYECLTGRPPFEGSLAQILMQKIEKEPVSPVSLLPEIPSELNNLCMQLLRINPEERPKAPEILSSLGKENQKISVGLSDSSPMPESHVFVGRDKELQTIRSACLQSREGAVAFLIEGESGLGKTALVRRFLENFSQEHIVFSGRCYEQESVPYKAFDSIIDALSRYLLSCDKEIANNLPENASLLGKLFPVLNRVPFLEKLKEKDSEIRSPQQLRSNAFLALREFLLLLGSKRSLLFFIDDIQWADQDSLVLLKELLRPPLAPPLFLLSTFRTSSEESDNSILHSLHALGVRRLALQALLPDEAKLLAKTLLASSKASSVLETEELAREAGGHPLFISELARYRAIRGKRSTEMRLDEALWERVIRLEPRVQRLVEFVSVAGTPVPQKVISEAAAISFGECLELIAELRQEQLVRTLGSHETDTVEPYHDRIRESVVAHLDVSVKQEYSRLLAKALIDTGAEENAPQVLVRHLEAAGEKERAAKLAERAAERARESLAFDRAAEFLRTALRLGQYTSTARKSLLLSLGEVLANAGRGPEAADAFLEAAKGQENEDTRLACQYRAAEQLLGSGYIDRGIELLKVVLREFGEEFPDTPDTALQQLLFYRKQLAKRGFSFTPKPPSQIARLDKIKLDIFKAISLCLAFVDNVRGAYFQIKGLLLALETGDLRRTVRALIIEAIYRAQEGESGRIDARSFQDLACQIALDQSRDTYLVAYITIGEAFLSYYRGSFREAAARFKDAEECFRNQIGTPWELNIARLHRLRATDYQGAWNQLRPLFNEYVQDAQRRDDRYAEASLTRWFNVLWLAQDDADKAGEELDRKLWTPPSGGYHLQHFLELRARVELALYRGQAAAQSEWALPALNDAERSLLFRIEIAQVIADWLCGRLALANAEILSKNSADKERHIKEAERMAKRMIQEKICYALIWGNLLLAGAAFQEKDQKRSFRVLEETIKISETNDFPLCAAVAKRRQGEILGGMVGSESGFALIKEANGWMQNHEIKNPSRMSEIFAPGFGFTLKQ